MRTEKISPIKHQLKLRSWRKLGNGRSDTTSASLGNSRCMIQVSSLGTERGRFLSHRCALVHKCASTHPLLPQSRLDVLDQTMVIEILSINPVSIMQRDHSGCVAVPLNKTRVIFSSTRLSLVWIIATTKNWFPPTIVIVSCECKALILYFSTL